MNIQIKTIPHKEQRYETVGDWTFEKNGDITIYISDMGNWKYEALVAVHELMEVLLCKDRKITQKEVDDFDKKFESKRKKGNEDEPGNDPDAPYYEEHQFASMIEEDLARQLNVKWDKYNKKVNSL